MSLRYAARTDRNQTPIVEELRRLGFDVDIVSREKKLYDVIVSGVAVWSFGLAVAVRVEIKTEGGSLTPDEQAYWDKQNNPGNLIIAHSTEDVLHWFGKAW